MRYRVTTPVATEPVTLAEARLQCKVDSDDTTHDALLNSLITAAGEFFEYHTGRGRAPQTIELALDDFPRGDDSKIELPLCPIASITSIKYTDTNGTEQTIAGASYFVSPYGLGNIVAPAFGFTWPSARSIADAVRIVAVVGYATLPKAAKAAILLHVETEFPLNALSMNERMNLEHARDALLETVKVRGF